MSDPSWVLKAEREMGCKWADIEPFTRLQYQLATPLGRMIYNTPVIPRWEGGLLSKQPKQRLKGQR